jgi:Flp pilus assembly protein TadD
MVTLIFQQRAGAMANLEVFPLGSRVANALVSCLRYAGMMIWPTRLAVLYPHPGTGLSPWWGAGAGLVLLGLTLLLLRGARSRPWLAVGWLWFIGTLVPVIGLVQVGVQARADRYTYVPLIGLFILVAWGAADLVGRRTRARTALVVVAIAALGALGVSARAQLGCWKDSVSLFTQALRVTSNNYVMHNELGVALARLGRSDEAMTQFREALRIKPDHAEAHNNLANALADRGKGDEAISHYAAALRIRPGGAGTCNNWGTVLLEQGRFDAAIDRFLMALKVEPDYTPARCNMGLALEKLGKPEEAIAQYREALRRHPDYAPAHNSLGIVLARLGKLDEAAAHFREALRINPGDDGARRSLADVLGRMANSTGKSGPR